MNYVKGANIAGFIKVADAMLAYGRGCESRTPTGLISPGPGSAGVKRRATLGLPVTGPVLAARAKSVAFGKAGDSLYHLLMARHFNTAGICRPDDHYMLAPEAREGDGDPLEDGLEQLRRVSGSSGPRRGHAGALRPAGEGTADRGALLTRGGRARRPADHRLAPLRLRGFAVGGWCLSGPVRNASTFWLEASRTIRSSARRNTRHRVWLLTAARTTGTMCSGYFLCRSVHEMAVEVR